MVPALNSRQAKLDNACHPLGDFGWLFMLPDTDSFPTSEPESLNSIRVPSLVGGDLRRPVPGVDLMLPAPLLRAAVPVAAIHKHGDSCAPEDNVSPAAEFW